MKAIWTIWVRNDLGFDEYLDICAQSVDEAIKIINKQVGEEYVEVIGCVACSAYKF